MTSETTLGLMHDSTELDEDWIKVHQDDGDDIAEIMKELTVLESAEESLMRQVDDMDHTFQQKRKRVTDELENLRADKLPLLQMVRRFSS